MLTLLFDDIAYGMLLFVLAVGLAVTLGLMNFINLAHGSLYKIGAYFAAAGRTKNRPLSAVVRKRTKTNEAELSAKCQ